MVHKIYTTSLLAALMVSGLTLNVSAQARVAGFRNGFRGFGHSTSAPRTPMAKPSVAPQTAAPGVGSTIASTAAGTAAGVVAGNAISNVFSDSSDKDGSTTHPQSQPQAQPQPVVEQQPVQEPQEVPVVTTEAGEQADEAAIQQEMANPCTQSLEQRNPRIEELCGRLHQEIKLMHQAPARPGNN